MSRAALALALAGVLLAISLFLPWFDGVTGWEHWAWADVVLVVLAADLVAATAIRPIAAHRIAIAVLCGLGIAVVIGHGLEPRDDASIRDAEALAGPYVALAALGCGLVAALAPWIRRRGPAGRAG